MQIYSEYYSFRSGTFYFNLLRCYMLNSVEARKDNRWKGYRVEGVLLDAVGCPLTVQSHSIEEDQLET